MTLPDMMHTPRAAASDAIVKVGGAEVGKAVGKGEGKAAADFAAALAGIMGRSVAPVGEGETPVEGGTALPGTAQGVEGMVAEGAFLDGTATAGSAEAMLDDLAKTVALLPAAAAQAATPEDGIPPETAETPVPGAALQAALAGMVKPSTPLVTDEIAEEEVTAPEEGGEAEEGEAVPEEAVIDPLLALGLAQVSPATTPLAEGEGEMAVGAAVSAALAGGLVQPMATQQVRTAPLPMGLEPGMQTGAAGTTGTESPIQNSETAVPEPETREDARAEAGARRDIPMIQQSQQAAERAAAKPADTGAQAVDALAAKAVETGATASGSGTQALQPSPQSAPQSASLTGLPGNPAPIAMNRPGWEGAIAERIEAELSGDGQIELDLTPEHLGRLKIRLDMVDGQTMVRFVTETPEAARLIQQNEHRLSETLSRAGLSLGGQETASRDPQGERQARGGGEAGGLIYERPAEAKAGTLAVPGRAAQGLVNLVA